MTFFVANRLRLTLTLPLIVACHVSLAEDSHPKSQTEVVVPSGLDWGALNPARGALGPRAANLWGDRTGTGAAGFLVRFADGFKSPPHIHNITYRGVVISGRVHNDDPSAMPMWMPSGSYWTQPVGEVHITAADGDNCLVYVEIQSGPYLVQPTEQASDNGERPVNVHASNIVWLDASTTGLIKPVDRTNSVADGPKVSFLWNVPERDRLTAALVKLPAKFKGTIRSKGSNLRCVVVRGSVEHNVLGQPKATRLEPGAYFGSQGRTTHVLSSDQETDAILYVRTDGKFDLVQDR